MSRSLSVTFFVHLLASCPMIPGTAVCRQLSASTTLTKTIVILQYRYQAHLQHNGKLGVITARHKTNMVEAVTRSSLGAKGAQVLESI